jgi:hypothetical protein
VHALLQQYPSAKKPVLHWFAPVAGAPGMYLTTHFPLLPSQKLPLAQSVSTAHDVGHDVDVPLQTAVPQPVPALPSGSTVQVPLLAVWLQESQPSVQAVLQQTPFAQLPLEQIAEVVHDVPFGCGDPQAPVAGLHVWPDTQSALVAQVVLHDVAPQRYGVQACVVAAGQ